MSDELWFRFFPSKFMAGIRGLSANEVKVYIGLLCRMYEGSGPITANREILSTYCEIRGASFDKALNHLIRLEKIQALDDGTLVVDEYDPWLIGSVRSPIPAAIRSMVIERDGRRCVYCGDNDGPFEVDHIFPVSMGGSGDVGNLACACLPCNRSKGAKTVEQWDGRDG